VLVGRNSRARFDVVGLGENSLDRIVTLDGWPSPGAKLSLEESGVHPGGQVASAILGCARLGLRCAYLGAVGQDEAAGTVLAPLRRAGVDVEGVASRLGARTRTALILVRRADGERCVMTCRDPELDLSPPLSCEQTLAQSRIVHLDASDPEASLWAARVARESGIPVVLDLDEVCEAAEALLAVADFPVVSRSFAETWGGTGDPEAGLERLARGSCRLAVVTCESAGAIAHWRGRQIQAEGFAVSVRDSTGAGDAFRAGFIWGLLQGQGVTDLLQSANAVAALSCMQLGAQSGLPDLESLTEFLSGL